MRRSSDRSPGELGRLVGLPSNLLAHHLDVLDRADLIERLQSSGDRRRSYVRVRCKVLRGLGPEAMTGVPDDAQLVTVCDQAREDLGTAVDGWHWSIADPVPVGSDEAFDAAVRELHERISTLTRSGGTSHG